MSAWKSCENEWYRSSSHKLIILFVVIVEAVIVFGLGGGEGALFLLFVLLSSQRVSSHSCETLRELPDSQNEKHPLISCALLISRK